MLAIINAELVLRDHFMPEAVLLIEDGKIVGFGEMRNTPIPDNCTQIDAHGAYVGPGFIDIHTHAAKNIRFSQDPIAAAQHHLSHGTTTVLPTPGTRLSREQLVQMGHDVHAAMTSPGGENIAGLYMEGPYLNTKYGTGRHENPWNKPVLAEDYEPIIAACGDIARVWGLAPERGLDQLLPFIEAAKKANPNVRFAVTHSEATPQQIEALMPYGLCIGTHHTNATGTIVNYPECRGVCVDEAVNYNREIYAELISDYCGVHVDPYMQRLIRRIKGDDRIILISDSTSYVPSNPPGYEHVPDLNFDAIGDISGNRLVLEEACRNFIKHTGASLVDAFRCASLNPATALGLTDRGEIAVGKRADLVFVDDKVRVQKVLLGGSVVVEK